MFRSLVKHGFVLVKSRNIRTEFKFNEDSLNWCRQLFNVGKPLGCSLEENSARYIKERITTEVQVSPLKMLSIWNQLRPMECQVRVLTSSQSFSVVEQQYLQNFFRFWGTFFLNNDSQLEQDIHTFQTAIKDCMDLFKSLIYLTKPTQETIMIFFRMFTQAAKKKIINQESYLSPLRFCFEALLDMPKIGLGNWSYLLYMTTTYSPHFIYHEKEKEIFTFLNNQIPKNWTAFLEQRTVKNLIHNLLSQSDPPRRVRKQINQLLTQSKNPQIKYVCLSFLLQFFEVTPSTVRKPEYLSAVEAIVSEGERENVRNLAKLFSFADIWIVEFWEPYFEMMMQGDNYEISYIVDQLMIDDLLTSGVGGLDLVDKALEYREFMKTKGIDFTHLNFRDQHQKVYGKRANQKNSCQQNVANSLKLICGAEVLTEVPIKFFMVDILVDKKIAIQINNESHYKMVKGERMLDLKSSFRKRVLERAGFEYKAIRVIDYVSSNYQMLEDVYKIAESCSTLKVKMAKPLQKQL